MLEELAEDFETRIALTTLAGALIADSAVAEAGRASGGELAPLPARPVRTIDASSPLGGVFNPCEPFPGESVEEIEIVVEDEDGDLDTLSCLAEPAPPALLYLGSADAGGGIALPSGTDLRIIGAVLAVLAVVLVLTVAGSQRILRPVAELTVAARRMQAGNLDERVGSVGDDEIGRLAHAFNSMAASLAESERERRTLTDDIAHELRTPLSNIRGYLEAIQDGVMEPTPEVVGSVHEEALLLQQLVDDLQTLSLAESGHLRLTLESLDLAALSRQVVTAHQAQAEAAGVRLLASGDAASLRPLDGSRMRQVLGNLISNALRHTPAGGTITVTVAAGGGGPVPVRVRHGRGHRGRTPAAPVRPLLPRRPVPRPRDGGQRPGAGDRAEAGAGAGRDGVCGVDAGRGHHGERALALGGGAPERVCARARACRRSAGATCGASLAGTYLAVAS